MKATCIQCSSKMKKISKDLYICLEDYCPNFCIAAIREEDYNKIIKDK